MEKVARKLSRLLEERFPGGHVELRHSRSPAVGGFLIWDGFDGMNDRERLRQIDHVLKRKLSEEENRKVSVIAPFTTEEMAAWRQEMARPENQDGTSGRNTLVGG